VPGLESHAPGDRHEDRRKGRNPWLRSLSWLPGIVLLGAVVAVVKHRGEGRHFALLLQQARPAWLLAGAVLQGLTYVCSAGVWQRVLARAGSPRERRPLRSLAPLAVARLFVDQIFPTGGLGGRVLVVRAFHRRGVRTPVAVAAILVDLLTLYGAFAVAVLVSLAILWISRDLSHVILSLAALFSVMAAGIPFTVLWLSRSERKPPRWARRIPRLESTLREIGRAPNGLVRDPALLLQGGALQLAVFLLDAATLWTMLRAIGYSAPPSAVFASFVLSQAAATVILMPGGLGSFEAASVALLALSDVPVETALTATLLLRGLTYWLPMLPGLWLSRREIRRIAKSPLGEVKTA
jgi:uncharacterized protein (TIRG00374 family)